MSRPIAYDEAFRERIESVFKGDGSRWLASLPQLLDGYAGRWSIEIGDAFAPLSYGYVAAAERADGTRAVLKAGVPRHDLQFEIEALRHYDGHGAVRLLEADIAAGVMLIERAEPGTPIIAIDDAEATRVAAGIMRELWRAPEPERSLPTISDWGAAFRELRDRHEGGSGLLPRLMFERGDSLYHELAATQGEAVVLHGDLHHWNIVSAARAPWLAIDPHGLVGEPAFEVGSWMRNPVADPGGPYETQLLARRRDARAVLSRRLDIFSEELAIDRQRLRDWSIAFAMLSACWSDESGDRHGVEQASMVAAHLAAM